MKTIRQQLGITYIVARIQNMKLGDYKKYSFEFIDTNNNIGYSHDFKVWELIGDIK